MGNEENGGKESHPRDLSSSGRTLVVVSLEDLKDTFGSDLASLQTHRLLWCVLCESCRCTKGRVVSTAGPQCVQGHRVCWHGQAGLGVGHLAVPLQGSICEQGACSEL